MRELADGVIVVRNKSAHELTRWLELSVFTALDAGYLDSINLVIYGKNPVSGADVVLESYSFQIASEGEGSGGISSCSKSHSIKINSKEDLKDQALRFVRALIGTDVILYSSVFILKLFPFTTPEFEHSVVVNTPGSAIRTICDHNDRPQ